MMKKYSVLAIIASAVLWGSMGLFTRTLAGIGFSSLQIAFFRLTFAAVMMIVVMLLKNRNAFKVDIKDIPFFALTGVVSVFLMSFFYFKAISLSSMSASAILLYTAPFFVTVAAAILYKEKITDLKVTALITAFAGSVLVSGIGGNVSTSGIIFGLLSGIAYASYSIFNKKLLQKYDSYTVTLWNFMFASVATAFSINPFATLTKLVSHGGTMVLVAVLMALVTAVLPFSLYTYGLKYTEAGKASVIATLEPLTATVAGAVVYGEYPSPLALVGIVLIVAAIVLLNKK